MSGRAPLRAAVAGATIAILAAVVLAADQLTKQLAIGGLVEHEPVPVLGEALQWYLVYNPGAAFSIGEGMTWVFTIAMGVVAVAIVVLAVTRIRSRLWAVVLGLLLGGVLGNLVDRLFREPGFGVGHVVDFVLTPWMWFWTTPAIYNVADVFIVSMMIAVALLVLVGIGFDGTRERRAGPDGDAGVAADGDAQEGAGPADGAAPAADGTPGPSSRVVPEKDAGAGRAG